MQSPRFLVPTLLLCALALVGSNAWSAALAKSHTKNRLAAKIKPEPVVVPEPLDDTPLSEDQIAASANVHSGDADCEFKNKVTVSPHPDKPGRFRLQFGKMVYNMAPELTTTGAVRLEDKQAGVVWLQIPAKSMLMNARVGQRMVDSCMHSAQVSEAQTAALAAARESAEGLLPGPDGLGIIPTEAAAELKPMAPANKPASRPSKK